MVETLLHCFGNILLYCKKADLIGLHTIIIFSLNWEGFKVFHKSILAINFIISGFHTGFFVGGGGGNSASVLPPPHLI